MAHSGRPGATVRSLLREPSRHPAVALVFLALFTVGALLGLYRLAEGRVGVLVAGAVVLCGVVLAAARGLVLAITQRRQRVRELAAVGRFAAQLAHDLKNPLAVLKGAAQYLREEVARGHGPSDHGEFLDLILQELERMRRVVDNYQRLGRVEALPAPGELNHLVRGVMALQAFAGGGVTVALELAEGLPLLALDRDLVEGALKNLVRNAFEAMADGGRLTVSTAREVDGVSLVVRDTGAGMDASTLERALESFYTTRPGGSGLGLAFARRVMEAHDGSLTLTSAPGEGTVVTLRFPS